MPADDSTTSRQREWGTTMRGHRRDGVEVAHVDSSAAISLPRVVDRKIREKGDFELSVGASVAVGAGNRALDEEPDQLRTCFERDRDRIVHATAFRRLAGKTQVVVDPGDHQRTRLTHALEVAQVARSVAEALGLNVALAEAIALGHDCGHGPGGHASEDAFAPYLPGGFDHAVWGADVTLVPLNLCAETLDGIRNHSWSRPAPSTPEGEVVSWADRIAYVCHDFEDAVAAGMVTPESLPAIVVDRCGLTRRLQLAAFIHSMVRATEATGQIAMGVYEAEALAAFREFNYRNIYLRPQSRQQADKVVAVLRGLVDYLIETPDQLPDRLRDSVEHETHAPALAAVAWVAGMTDQFAFRSAQHWLGWDPTALPTT